MWCDFAQGINQHNNKLSQFNHKIQKKNFCSHINLTDAKKGYRVGYPITWSVWPYEYLYVSSYMCESVESVYDDPQ